MHSLSVRKWDFRLRFLIEKGEVMYKVGDVVLTKNKEQRKIVPAVVVKVDREWSVNVLFKDGEVGFRNQDKIKPAGYSIGVQSVLDSIR